jgi:hypothetical protein
VDWAGLVRAEGSPGPLRVEESARSTVLPLGDVAFTAPAPVKINHVEAKAFQ